MLDHPSYIPRQEVERQGDTITLSLPDGITFDGSCRQVSCGMPCTANTSPRIRRLCPRSTRGQHTAPWLLLELRDLGEFCRARALSCAQISNFHTASGTAAGQDKMLLHSNPVAGLADWPSSSA